MSHALAILGVVFCVGSAQAGESHSLYDVNGNYAGSLVTAGGKTSYFTREGWLIRKDDVKSERHAGARGLRSSRSSRPYRRPRTR
jgi:hypothetical protein